MWQLQQSFVMQQNKFPIILWVFADITDLNSSWTYCSDLSAVRGFGLVDDCVDSIFYISSIIPSHIHQLQTRVLQQKPSFRSAVASTSNVYRVYDVTQVHHQIVRVEKFSADARHDPNGLRQRASGMLGWWIDSMTGAYPIVQLHQCSATAGIRRVRSRYSWVQWTDFRVSLIAHVRR